MNKFIAHAVLIFVVLLPSFVYEEYPKWKNYSDKNLHAYFFNVGNGDSAMVKTADRKIILIDGGPGRAVIYRVSQVLPFWVNKIDFLIVSHSHADHITGLLYVLEKYEVGCVLYENQDDPISKIEEELRHMLDQKSIPACDKSAFEYYKTKTSNITGKNQNLESLVLTISYKDFDILFTGDAEIPLQQIVLPQLQKDIEVIKVPHQGSSDSFYPPLLRKLQPEIGIIPVGAKNKYGHPHKETLQGYNNLRIKLLRTDQNGTIHIRSDGYIWEAVK